jgi:hypothetical protein
MARYLVSSLFLFGFLSHSLAIAQRDHSNLPRADSSHFEKRAAGPQYQAGGLHRFFFGDHHRELWTTPVEVPTLDLSSFAGGLKPAKRGGGFQTKSLRFKSGDGREFAFRSIDKDPEKALPPELRETIASDVLRDQISSANPYAPLVVPVIAEALGVLHPEPQLVIMPDDARLGEFRQEFANLMGFIEERPADGPDGEAGFAGSDKIVGTDELFLELQEDNDDYVQPRSYLIARLLDIFLGDWDRHADQWRWARFKEGKKKVWHPIPRDRDQAFVKLDGLAPSLAEKRYVVRNLENFYKNKPDIISLTHSGRHTDRPFLNSLTRDDFDAVQKEVAAKLTDQVIEKAVHRLPPPIYAIEGADLARRLKERRDHLPIAGKQFYEFLAQYPEIVTSDKGEHVDITRVDDDHVRLQIYKRDKDTGEKKIDDLLYDRTFKRSETKEIRLFLMGGKDKAVVTGQTDKSILVRIIGGGQEDEIVDESKVAGRFLLLFPEAESKTFVYDTKSGNQFVTGPSTKLKTGAVDSIINFREHKPLLRDYGYDAKPLPFFAYTPDDGVFLGAGLKYLFYGFRKSPYSSMLTVAGNYAFLTNAFRVRFISHLVDVKKNLDFTFAASTTVPQEVTNFYGLGNAAPRDATLEKNEFYRVRSEEYLLSPMLHVKLQHKTVLSFITAYRRFETKFKDDDFISAVRPYGSDIGSVFQLGTALTYDSRIHPVASWRGFFFRAGAIYYPKTFKNDNDFTKTIADMRVFFTPLKPLSLAARARGEKIFGTFPYYEAAYLGGSRSLRGFLRERFGGDASVLGSAEARLYLLKYKFLFQTSLGILAGVDAGRVWVDDNSPGGWHTSATGGIWFAPIFATNVVSFSLASSPEGLRLTIGGGFAF